jgi:hypothetical protein
VRSIEPSDPLIILGRLYLKFSMSESFCGLLPYYGACSGSEWRFSSCFTFPIKIKAANAAVTLAPIKRCHSILSHWYIYYSIFDFIVCNLFHNHVYDVPCLYWRSIVMRTFQKEHSNKNILFFFLGSQHFEGALC